MRKPGDDRQRFAHSPIIGGTDLRSTFCFGATPSKGASTVPRPSRDSVSGRDELSRPGAQDRREAFLTADTEYGGGAEQLIDRPRESEYAADSLGEASSPLTSTPPFWPDLRDHPRLSSSATHVDAPAALQVNIPRHDTAIPPAPSTGPARARDPGRARGRASRRGPTVAFRAGPGPRCKRLSTSMFRHFGGFVSRPQGNADVPAVLHESAVCASPASHRSPNDATAEWPHASLMSQPADASGPRAVCLPDCQRSSQPITPRLTCGIAGVSRAMVEQKTEPAERNTGGCRSLMRPVHIGVAAHASPLGLFLGCVRSFRVDGVGFSTDRGRPLRPCRRRGYGKYCSSAPRPRTERSVNLCFASLTRFRSPV
jgi:hypothetical protein